MATGLRVEGLTELQRSLTAIKRDLGKELRLELRKVAEPVRVRAEQLAMRDISHIGPRWGQMRVGVTTGFVYVAPKSRRRGGSPRPNLGSLLVKKALLPARDESVAGIELGVERMLDRVASEHGFWD